MKNSGSEAGGNPDDVLDLVLRDSEVLGDARDAVTGTEPVDEVLDAGTAMDDEGLPKRALWINDHVGGCVGRKLDLLSPAISAVADALEIPADDLSEMFLAGPYNGQQGVVVAGAGVVEDQFGAVVYTRWDARAWSSPNSSLSRATAGRMRCIGTPAWRRTLNT